MSVKKITLLLAGFIGATALSACTDPNRKVNWGDYWKKDTLSAENIDETLTYDVTFEEGAGIGLVGYALAYENGSYITTLKSNTTDSGTQYTYTSKMEISVRFTLGEDTAVFTDLVESTVVFMNADNALRPISSAKKVVSHTPASASDPTKLEECYTAYEYTTETTYGENGKANTKVDDLTDEKNPSSHTFTYGDGDYGYLDNEQLYLALRAVPSTTTSAKVEIHNPFLEMAQMVDFTFNTKTGGEFTHTVNGAPLASKDISYRSVTMALDSNNPGSTQTAWIATSDSPSKNTHRNVMLYLSTPLAYNLGSLEYVLIAVVNA